jgi:hypothetical protein
MNTSKRIVISSYAGGLGDTLCCSTLPEMYARQGYEVFIGRPRVEKSMRNPESQKIIWEMNPFVSGFVDEAGISFSHKEMHQHIWAQNDSITLVEAMESLHGFKPAHRFPKIYYQPKWRSEFKETIFADPTSISQTMRPDVFDSYIDHICRARDYDKNKIIVLSSNYAGRAGAEALAGNERLQVNDIFEYADLIYSCALFITSESGGAILASAIRGTEPCPEIFSLFTNSGMNDRLFQFPNVRYCSTGQMGGDFYVHTDVPIVE